VDYKKALFPETGRGHAAVIAGQYLFLSPKLMLAGFGTVLNVSPLPRLHRASPSASLDKKVSI